MVSRFVSWELWREFSDNTEPPFLSVPGNQELVDRVLNSKSPSPSTLSPLDEAELQEAQDQSRHAPPFDDGTVVKAFRISRDADTEATVAQFRNWLIQFKRGPDRRKLASAFKPQPGRKNLDAHLKAIAVRRLKLAEYSRQEAENMLGLKRYALKDFWRKHHSMIAAKLAECQKMLATIG